MESGARRCFKDWRFTKLKVTMDYDLSLVYDQPTKKNHYGRSMAPRLRIARQVRRMGLWKLRGKIGWQGPKTLRSRAGDVLFLYTSHKQETQKLWQRLQIDVVICLS